MFAHALNQLPSLIDECSYIIDAVFPQLIHDMFHIEHIRNAHKIVYHSTLY
jgi:hypothetical protein